MEIRLVQRPAEEIEAGALILAYPKETGEPGPWKGVDGGVDGILAAALSGRAFRGEAGQVVAVPTHGRGTVDDLLLTGLGEPDEVDLEAWRRAVAAGLVEARSRGHARVVVGVADDGSFGAAEGAEAATVAALLATYRYTRYKDPGPDSGEVEHLLLAVPPGTGDSADVEAAATVADATCWARDLVNAPGNDKRPPELARIVTEALQSTDLEVDVLDAGRCEELGMNALLAVGGGSAAPPAILTLAHRGADGPPILLVGKGVTFDSGGISIKSSKNMGDMKGDMAGAAAVVATLRAVSELRLPLHVVGVTPLAENLPSATSYRPGDIVRGYGDQSIEVINTDAEGRLILADALAWARERYEPERIVDLATLTGSCVVALGDHVAGLMTADDDLAEELLTASDATGDRIWRLPLWSIYDRQIDSDVADVKNSGGRPAGAITAARFLRKFVDDAVWAHLDIAGPAFLSSADGYRPKGGTGFGVRLLCRWLEDRT